MPEAAMATWKEKPQVEVRVTLVSYLLFKAPYFFSKRYFRTNTLQLHCQKIVVLSLEVSTHVNVNAMQEGRNWWPYSKYAISCPYLGEWQCRQLMRGGMRGSGRVLCHSWGKVEMMWVSHISLTEANEMSSLFLDHCLGGGDTTFHTKN